MSITKSASNGLSLNRQSVGWLGVFLFSFTANAYAGQVSLSWDASTGPVAGYRIYYGNTSRTVNNNTYASSQNVGNTTTTTLNLAEGATYYFAAKAYDSAGIESDFSNEVTKTLSVAAPTASFSADKTSGTAPVTINFTDNSTGNITSRSWNFGDGTSSTAQNPSKTYSNSGTYTVKLTVAGSGGTTTSTKTISVTAPTVAAPSSSFTATPTSGTAPLLVTLTDTSTGTVSSRSWDLGDGTTSTSQTVAKTYNSAGTYTVKLTVKNAGGSSTTTKTISTTATAPSANFTVSASTGTAPLATTFTNISTGTVLNYAWNFGDPSSQSNTSTAQNPSHTYQNAGTYTVTLTATGPTGTTPSTKTQAITVKATTTASSSNNGLVAAYNFEEGYGATIVDASGKGNHGITRGTVRVSKGKFGQAASFDGIDDWITVNDSATLDLTTGMTLEAWVYPTAPMSGWRAVVNKEQPNGFGAAYYLAANSDLNQPEAAIYTTAWNKLYGGPMVSANQWTHLAGTYDGATFKLYVNGVQVSSQPQTGSIDVTTGVLRIGGNDYWGEFFKGYIDEVRVYNRALNASEIATDMNTSITSSSPPKLLVGSQTLGSTSYSLPKGTAAAFQSTATSAGVVNNIAVYVDQNSSPTRLMAGIYADSNGHPGQLLKGYDDIAATKIGAWNVIRVPGIEIAAGQKYWIAVLSPNGLLNIRTNNSAGSQPSETNKVTALTSLPKLWATGTISTNGLLSGYGAGY